ncbi:MAG: TetR/AcrR family transcriptional regulator [Candidatus Promineofilum sp.]|nr:TetR/AcrR family transcriptional regulator [Promineifilum sp.]
MARFWKNGYEATSVRDLTACTGLSTSSLYATFGDKYELYGAALDKYRAIEREQFAMFLSVEQPLRPLLALMFAGLIDGLLAADDRGSFTLNAAVEMGGRDTTIARRLRDHFDDVSDMLAERLAAAQAVGDIPATRSPAELARYLLFGIYTLALMAKFYPDREQLNGTAEILLAVLDVELVRA